MALAAAAGDGGDTSEETQGIHSSPTSHDPAAAAPPSLPGSASTAHQGEENPADRIRQAQMFSANRISHFRCVLNETFKGNFLCQWISPQYFFFNLSSSDLLEFPKSKNSVKINNTAMYLTKIPFQSTNSLCTQQKAQKLSGKMLAWAE